MKKIPFIIALFYTCNLINAQDCYQPLLQAGIEAFDQSDFRKALDQFEAAAFCEDEADKSALEQWVQKTQKLYINAIEEKNKDTEALQFFSLGQEQECKGFFRVAFDHYSDAVSIRPAIIRYRERRLDLALNEEIAAYKIAQEDLAFLIEHGPKEKQSSYFEVLSSIKEQLGDLDGALSALNKAKQKSNDFSQVEVYEVKKQILKFKRGDIKIVKNDSMVNTGETVHLQIPQDAIVLLKDNKAGYRYDLRLKIDGKEFMLSDNKIALWDLEKGSYQYTITGTIETPDASPWPVSGTRTITIRPSQVYYLYWEKNTYGQCEAWISNF